MDEHYFRPYEEITSGLVAGLAAVPAGGVVAVVGGEMDEEQDTGENAEGATAESGVTQETIDGVEQVGEQAM